MIDHFRACAFAVVAMAAVSPALAGEKEDPRCSLYGPGFVYTAGGTCVRLSGGVEASYGFGSKSNEFGTESEMQLDVRKDTEAGPLRLFVAPRAKFQQ